MQERRLDILVAKTKNDVPALLLLERIGAGRIQAHVHLVGTSLQAGLREVPGDVGRERSRGGGDGGRVRNGQSRGSPKDSGAPQ